VPDLPEALGEYVKEEAPDELLGVQPARLLAVRAEDDRLVAHRDELVGDL
jgi:hypothetical protein